MSTTSTPTRFGPTPAAGRYGDALLCPHGPAQPPIAGSLTISAAASGVGIVASCASPIVVGHCEVQLVQAQDTPETGDTSPCFAAGTRVLSTRGWVAVEHLAIGDRLITARRTQRTLRWIGRRRIDCSRHPAPERVLPVRVTAHAFGPDLPQCDIVLSPDHAVFIDNLLVPIKHLVNGATIRQEKVRQVSYFHLELGSHDVLLAENLPVESYLDTGDRHHFSNGGNTVSLHAEFAHAPPTRPRRACAQSVAGGPVVRRARAHLLARADALGYAMTHDADLHLCADGKRIWGNLANGVWSGWLPAGTRSITIVSRATAPSDCIAESEDRRRLGVALSRIVLRADAATRVIGAETTDWGTGIHPPEYHAGQPCRWTNGHANLPPSLWHGIDTPFRLDLHILQTLTYRCEEQDVLAELSRVAS